jgi:hypothetical protein
VSDEDVPRALALLELSYCYHRLALGERDDERGLDPHDSAPGGSAA